MNINELKLCGGCYDYEDTLDNITYNDCISYTDSSGKTGVTILKSYSVLLGPHNDMCIIKKNKLNNSNDIILKKHTDILKNGKIIKAQDIGESYENSNIRLYELHPTINKKIYINVDGLYVAIGEDKKCDETVIYKFLRYIDTLLKITKIMGLIKKYFNFLNLKMIHNN